MSHASTVWMRVGNWWEEDKVPALEREFCGDGRTAARAGNDAAVVAKVRGSFIDGRAICEA